MLIFIVRVLILKIFTFARILIKANINNSMFASLLFFPRMNKSVKKSKY